MTVAAPSAAPPAAGDATALVFPPDAVLIAPPAAENVGVEPVNKLN